MSVIDDYFSTLSPEQHAALEALRHTVKKLVPDAEDGWSYAMPTIKLNGHGLVGFLAYKHHLGFYPFGSAPILAAKDQLVGYKTSTGAVQFTIEKPLPAGALEKMVRVRQAQILEKKPKQ